MLNKFEKDMEKLEKATRTLEKAIALAEVAGPSQFKKRGQHTRCWKTSARSSRISRTWMGALTLLV